MSHKEEQGMESLRKLRESIPTQDDVKRAKLAVLSMVLSAFIIGLIVGVNL